MPRGLAKAERLRDLERVLVERRWSEAELAHYYGVNRSTIHRNLEELEVEVPLERQEGKVWIARTRYLSNIRVNPHEQLAIYLALRRLARVTPGAQPHIARVLQAVARILNQPMMTQLIETATRRHDGTGKTPAVEWLEQVVEGWVTQRKVEIDYRRLHAHQPLRHLVSPYLIEPSLWSDATYLVAGSNRGGLTNFKIERITYARVTTEPYEIPASFDSGTLFRYAWGIIGGDDHTQPQQVRLRFNRYVTARIRESMWHETAKITPCDDGGCELSVQLADTREILPWIRSWGADCEVLAPPSLRDQVAGDARRMDALYGAEAQPESGGSRLRVPTPLPRGLRSLPSTKPAEVEEDDHDTTV